MRTNSSVSSLKLSPCSAVAHTVKAPCLQWCLSLRCRETCARLPWRTRAVQRRTVVTCVLFLSINSFHSQKNVDRWHVSSVRNYVTARCFTDIRFSLRHVSQHIVEPSSGRSFKLRPAVRESLTNWKQCRLYSYGRFSEVNNLQVWHFSTPSYINLFVLPTKRKTKAEIQCSSMLECHNVSFELNDKESTGWQLESVHIST